MATIRRGRRKGWHVVVTAAAAVACLSPAVVAASGATPNVAQLKQEIATSATMTTRPNLLKTIPPVTDTAWFESQPYPPRTNCFLQSGSALPADPSSTCSYGDVSAIRTILFIGDSHAAMLAPAIDVVGKLLYWHVIFLAKASCAPWIDPNARDYSGNSNASCQQFRRHVINYALRIRPTIVMPVGQIGSYGPGRFPSVSQLAREMANLFAALKSSAAKVVLLGDTPNYGPLQPDECLVAVSSPAQCEKPPSKLTNPTFDRAIGQAARQDRAPLVNILPLVCTQSACPLFVKSPDGVRLVYRDNGHFYRFYSQWIGRALATLLAPAL